MYTQESTTYNEVSNHNLIKNIVEEVTSVEIPMSLHNGEKIEEFLNYIVSANTHMYFTVDNFKVVTTFINEHPDIRDLILNIVDKVILDFIGDNGSIESLIEDLVTLVEITKNIGRDKTLYDSRLTDTLMFDREQLYDLLESNVYLIVVYYMVLNPYTLFKDLVGEDSGDTSKKV